MDMTHEEYIDFVNHLLLERMNDDDYSWATWAHHSKCESAQTVDAMTVIE